MKTSFFMLGLVAFFCTFAQSQNSPLRGNGKLVTQSFGFKDFDKINFEDFDGIIEVEVGKPFSITVEIDENLASRLKVAIDQKEYTLTVKLAGNYNGKLYLENTRIKIKVTLPEVSVIRHRGNTNLHVSGIVGRYFRLENNGNGNATLEGKIDELDLKKSGNGEVRAKNLVAKTAKVKSYGNGNVLVNSQISLTANGAGNCGVLQFGPGKIEPMSGIIGNGSVKSW